MIQKYFKDEVDILEIQKFFLKRNLKLLYFNKLPKSSMGFLKLVLRICNKS